MYCFYRYSHSYDDDDDDDDDEDDDDDDDDDDDQVKLRRPCPLTWHGQTVFGSSGYYWTLEIPYQCPSIMIAMLIPSRRLGVNILK